MKIEDYEKYYQKGGSYVIPTEVFNELFNELEAWKKQAKKIEMIRLDQTKKVFDIIANIIKEGSCSYRHLIYDELGFYGVNYEELLSGMTITNAICDLEELKEQHEEDLKEMEKLTSIWVTKNEEIRQLKEQLHEASLTIQEMTEQDIWCPSNCDKLEKLLKENKEMKKELENAVPNSDVQIVMNKVATQQKEFIKYLKEKIEELLIDYNNYVYDDYSEEKGKYDTCKEILQKYKEIIGGKE